MLAEFSLRHHAPRVQHQILQHFILERRNFYFLLVEVQGFGGDIEHIGPAFQLGIRPPCGAAEQRADPRQ